MTAHFFRLPASPETNVVDPEVFIDRLLCRSRLERDDDLDHGVFGLRDPSTGVRITVNAQDLTRYTARQMGRTHLPS
jgi:hypothetical protein